MQITPEFHLFRSFEQFERIASNDDVARDLMMAMRMEISNGFHVISLKFLLLMGKKYAKNPLSV